GLGTIKLGTGNLNGGYNITPQVPTTGYTGNPALWTVAGTLHSDGVHLQDASADIDFEAHLNTHAAGSLGASANILNVFHPGFETSFGLPDINLSTGNIPVVHWALGNPQFNANLGAFDLHLGLPPALNISDSKTGSL